MQDLIQHQLAFSPKVATVSTMVMPSPFDRLLQKLTEQTQSDPNGAFAEISTLFDKSASEDEVVKSCAFASNFGGAALGRLEETVEFLKKLLEHPAINFAESEGRRSVHRALAVMYICMGDEEHAKQHQEHGITNASEQCRFATMAANTLVARTQLPKSIPFLKMAAAASQEISPNDEVLGQVASVGLNISRLAEKQLTMAKDLLLHSTNACKEAWLRDDDWQVQHKALYLYAKALIKSGLPTKGLDVVQRMMKLERKNKAGPLEQFFSASVACRGQCMRGQVKIASQALGACEQLIDKIDDEHQEQAKKVYDEIAAVLNKERDRITRQ